MQIIRRFLIAPSLARLIRKERPSARVAEGYFATQSGRNSHVSVEGGQCQLVLVALDANGNAVEERTEVPRAHADALFDVCAGRAIYDRVRLPLGNGHDALVDRFAVPGALDVVSVEFEAADEALSFAPPAWFGPEVTGDHNYEPRHVALAGLPAVGEVALSNEALDNLLDVFEDRTGRGRQGLAQAPAARRSATDTSVIDALRRLASPDHSAEASSEGPPADLHGSPMYEEPAALPLSRRNYSPRPGETDAGHPSGSIDDVHTAANEAEARIDEVIATLSQALGTGGADADEPGPGMPEAERSVTRLRRLGS